MTHASICPSLGILRIWAFRPSRREKEMHVPCQTSVEVSEKPRIDVFHEENRDSFFEAARGPSLVVVRIAPGDWSESPHFLPPMGGGWCESLHLLVRIAPPLASGWPVLKKGPQGEPAACVPL